MILRMLFVLLLIQTAGATENKYFDAVKGLASGVGATFAAVAAGSEDTWSKLSTPQARRVLNGLSSDAESLYAKNKILEGDIEKHIRDNTAQTFDIEPRIQELRKIAASAGEKLEKFRHEVDQAIGGPEGHKRANTQETFQHKAEMLDDVEVAWKAGRYNDADIVLIDAMDELQKAQNGITCMQKTIDKQKTACDPQTLAPKSQ